MTRDTSERARANRGPTTIVLKSGDELVVKETLGEIADRWGHAGFRNDWVYGTALNGIPVAVRYEEVAHLNGPDQGKPIDQ